MRFATQRLGAADPAERAAGERLLRLAADLGNYDARQHFWGVAFTAAENKHEVHARWLAENMPNPSQPLREACFEHAVRLDRAAGEQLQQLEEAARWYWRALRAGEPERQNILRHAPSCRRIGEALNPGKSGWKLTDADLARAWYRRADELRGPGRAGG
jgi:TPR repeat protein